MTARVRGLSIFAKYLLLLALFYATSAFHLAPFHAMRKNRSIKMGYQNNIVAVGKNILAKSAVIALPLLGLMQPSFASSSSQTIKAVETIVRVSSSLDFISQDIAQKGDAVAIVSQIKFLLNTYKLKESVQSSIDVVPPNLREEARNHGRSAIEDLMLVFEYYNDEIDNFSGKRSPPKEILMFADEAVRAAKKELQSLIACYPSEVQQDVKMRLKEESP